MIFLVICLLISILINLIFFILAYYFQTDKFTDITYSLTYIILLITMYIKYKYQKISLLLFVLIFFWGIRLGIFLLFRILKYKKDKRFDEIRSKPLKFLKFWILQALSVIIILTPTLFAFQNIENNNFSFISYIGLFIWIIGFLIESVADIQKFLFNDKLNNKNKWIDIGLWKYSRHPNYFGEILIWIGIYFISLENLKFIQIFLGMLSPIYISILLLFVTGIPILEKKSDYKWGSNLKYKKYKKETPVLIPFLKLIK